MARVAARGVCITPRHARGICPMRQHRGEPVLRVSVGRPTASHTQYCHIAVAWSIVPGWCHRSGGGSGHTRTHMVAGGGWRTSGWGESRLSPGGRSQVTVLSVWCYCVWRTRWSVWCVPRRGRRPARHRVRRQCATQCVVWLVLRLAGRAVPARRTGTSQCVWQRRGCVGGSSVGTWGARHVRRALQRAGARPTGVGCAPPGSTLASALCVCERERARAPGMARWAIRFDVWAFCIPCWPHSPDTKGTAAAPTQCAEGVPRRTSWRRVSPGVMVGCSAMHAAAQ